MYERGDESIRRTGKRGCIKERMSTVQDGENNGEGGVVQWIMSTI